jgi:hypothetical protein
LKEQLAFYIIERMQKLPPIVRFAGQHHFLSNFYMHPFRYLGFEWPSAEHAYQAEKCAIGSDAQHILHLKTPGEAKRYGRRVLKRKNWEDEEDPQNRVNTMLQILRAKFSLWNPDQVTRNPLSIRLIQTGNADLIEGNTWGDTFWGQCPVGNGENMLGKLLMKVRSEISHAV